MTSKNILSPVWKIYKTTMTFLVPILGIIAVIAAVLSCFKSAEGSNSRIVAIITLAVSAAIIIFHRCFNQVMEKKNVSYRLYTAKIIRNVEPRILIPLCLLSVVIALPFILLFITSLKNPIEANALKFSWWPQNGVDLESYKELFGYSGSIGVTMSQAIVNSFVYAIIPTVIGLFVSALSAYGFAKLKFRGRNTMYQMLIMTMMMPGCVTLATAFMMYDWYGWTNSALPLIIPGCFGGATTVMFLREFFMGIPDGLLEAANIDGAGKWKSFFLIVLPLAKPALMAQFILTFITKYNDYMGPLIYLNDPAKYTIQVALDFLDGAVADNALIASAGVFSLVPMLTLYIIFQKQILSGISMSSGLKG